MATRTIAITEHQLVLRSKLPPRSDTRKYSYDLDVFIRSHKYGNSESADTRRRKTYLRRSWGDALRAGHFLVWRKPKATTG